MVWRVAVLVVMAAERGAHASQPDGDPDLAVVPAGSYRPLYGVAGALVRVDTFLLDRHAVTNAEFVDFVRAHPEWRRGNVTPLFAEPGYLRAWTSDLEPGPLAPGDRPVTEVSWFAAEAFCESRGMQLPTIDQWEHAARADELSVDATHDPAFVARILGWYGHPTTQPLPPVGSTYQNVWGAWDMHGLVWEWVLDFQSVLLSGESRKDGTGDPDLTCGGASLRSVDPSDYAAFMRYAMRASLRGDYALANLGFRCARGSGR